MRQPAWDGTPRQGEVSTQVTGEAEEPGVTLPARHIPALSALPVGWVALGEHPYLDQ